MLEIRNLHAVVEGEELKILKGVNLTVNKGEIHAIMGPNGSGKSTLLKILNRLEGPYQGNIFTIDRQSL